ncbi:hypothetical protein F4808DRAFT_457875 [Astrocystis sublimbata]|nr:hypothetical protein F4808DRAFT_457875 [Astrocystis sublimbata]
MNRFRTKKKAKDEEAPRPSQESDSSMSFFRRGKKVQESEKKEIDLTAALPSNDDFRTSLLMTGLSARFSMLREQDDPNTKIGKASDDSVLSPRRTSRMDMGAFRGLGDIAEVESIKAAAPYARMDSYQSDDADSLNGSAVMSRAKPTEGNNLFGGRQKIYKIPASAGSSRTVDGGMSGRALYDDDVAQSAFQKWRRAEKNRRLSHDDVEESYSNEEQRQSSTDIDPVRAESPSFSSYNRNRETSSTFSSIPSIARNSSAATSITSQPTPSLKDGQSPGGYSSGPERSVTRTRRLYETGFSTQDSQDPGTGTLSRMDTLSRQRPFGNRTPDMQQQPSLILADRLSGERKLLARGSAPNLRSMSPPASASLTGASNLGAGVPSPVESKSSFGNAPPLSPPISESDENNVSFINPNDRGKATALGVFQKPATPYDDTKFAQRQLLLQRGRETPTQRMHNEPQAPKLRSQSRSRSPDREPVIDSPTVPTSELRSAAAKGQVNATTFLADCDESETSSLASPRPLPSPQIHLRRPSDREHPALRNAGALTPLPVVTTPSGEQSPVPETSSLAIDSQGKSPVDSPTLGPVTIGGGLSGMVRQHLRGNSNASSIYGGVPPTSGLESRFPDDVPNSAALRDYGAGSNPWEDQGRDWNLDLDVNESIADAESLFSEPSTRPGESNGDHTNEKGDEFASQLADGARRIREKLTSFVETDSRSSSPNRLGDASDVADMASLPRPNGLSAILRPRSSRGSLGERGRDPSSPRAFKKMGISPGGSRTASPGSEVQRERSQTESELRRERESNELAQGGEDQHPGLRQFRQARRELQRQKELESAARHPPAPQGPPPAIPSQKRGSPTSSAGSRSRTPSQDQKASGYHQQGRPSEESENIRNGTPTRPGNGQAIRGNMHLEPSASAPRPAIRSPGLPGTDIKRSPIMPPQPHPNAFLRANQAGLDANGNLYAPRGYGSALPSPTSPGVTPMNHSAPPTPATLSPPRPPMAQTASYDTATGPTPGPHETYKRRIKTQDISEPTLVMSTSRVPTMELPKEAEDNRLRNNRPPVPPINPRRRQDNSKVRSVLETFARHGRDNMENEGTLNRPLRQKSDMNLNTNFNNSRVNAPPVHVGPPASRIVATQGKNNPGLPGGMI